ncbi:hypothetical protein AGMMS50267_01000 [Spirochaetia bacterium]|nr:hypothetical protein AGMMS50267_01000 [Spirochaetia bacterium]
MDQSDYSTIDEYIAHYPAEIQTILKKIRQTIRAAAPAAEEKISYSMPAFHQHQNLIYFGVSKNHIGIYPTADAMAEFAPRLTAYKTSKGAIQFPLSSPVPYDLIAEITRFRVKAVEGKRKKKA